MKRVIVTGAAGFLGSHLAKHHLEAGDQVMGVDDFSSSRRGSPHFNDLCSYENFNFFESSITAPINPPTFEGWQQKYGKFNIVYNFACPASPPRYQTLPIHTMLTCVVGTENMLKLAQKAGAILVHASTSEVYGDPNVTPQPESYRGCVNSYGPRACYDEGKRAAEALCYDYLNKFDMDARLVRIFNTYGPNMDPKDGRVVSNFICQALRGEKLTIYGDGEQGRSFCYVDDLIRGIVALGSLQENPGTPINLGNPVEFSVNDLARHVIYEVKSSSGHPGQINLDQWIDRRDMPVDDPTQRCPDITLARKILGWEPKVNLVAGLRSTIAHFRNVIV